MAKAPAFQFYADDFLAGTIHFSDAEVGQYIRLLSQQWNTGHLDPKGLASFTRSDTVSERVLLKFKTDAKGLLFNPRLETERIKQSAFRRKQAINGAKGGRPKVKGLGYSGLSEDEPKKSSPSPSPSPSPVLKSTCTRLYGIPESADEVVAFGRTCKPEVPEDRCRAFWAHYEGQARTGPSGDVFWVTSGDAVITNWKVKLLSFGEKEQNGKPWDKPKPETKSILERSVDATHRDIMSGKFFKI